MPTASRASPAYLPTNKWKIGNLFPHPFPLREPVRNPPLSRPSARAAHRRSTASILPFATRMSRLIRFTSLSASFSAPFASSAAAFHSLCATSTAALSASSL